MDNSGQDIVALGLNIDSFTTEKLVRLKEYILLFDNLAKYDGKIFNPIMGDGLGKFNTSLAETNRLIDEINVKLSRLNSAKVSPNAFPTRQVRELKNEVESSTIAIKNHGTQIVDSTSKIENMGRGLTRMFGYLRNIAYILPGLGIAGIFNVAFVAIESALEALIDFEDKEGQLIERNNEYNKSLRQTIENIKQLVELQNQLSKVQGSGFTGGDIQRKTQAQEDYVNLLNAEGQSKDKILQQELELAKIRKEKAVTDVSGRGGIGFLEGDIDKRSASLSKLKNQIVDVSDAIQRNLHKETKGVGFIDPETKTFITGKTDLNKKRESLQLAFDTESKSLKELEDIYSNYYKSIQDLSDKDAELKKFNNDQERKRRFEFAKEDISLNIERNKAILDNDKKFHDERDQAIKDNHKQDLRLNQETFINVKTNVSTTPKELQIAQKKLADDNEKADDKRKKDLEKNDTEFFQRKILAETEIRKDEIEQESIKNERIFQNEQNSLQDRIDAYQKYIEGKLKIEDEVRNLAIQRGASKEGGPTSLTTEEQQRIETHRIEQKSNIVANAEKQVYDIVYSYLRKQIKATEDEIAQEEDLSKEGYTKALHNLNAQYEDKKISLRKYHEQKKKIDYEYQKKELDAEILKDIADILKLKKLNAEKIEVEVEYRKQKLKIAKEGGDPTEIDKAQGAFDAAKQAEIEINKDIKNAKDKLSKDTLKREQVEPPDSKDRNKWVDAAVDIEKAINNSLQKLYDERIQNEIDMVNQRKSLIDEIYGYEQDAIEKSSLSQKDKLAYEIQIQAEKKQMDDNAIRQAHELKLNEFHFNKKLALADAAVGIAASIIRDGLTTPKSIADAVIGAVQVATIMASEPPALAKGVINWKGGLAKYGEAGDELVKKPGEKAFIATEETIGYLPKGTDVIPLRKDHPEFSNEKRDESWDQTRYLAKQIKKSNKEVKNIFKPNIIVDMGFEIHKRKILGN